MACQVEARDAPVRIGRGIAGIDKEGGTEAGFARNGGGENGEKRAGAQILFLCLFF